MFVIISITIAHCRIVAMGYSTILGRKNVMLGMMIEHHDTKALCLHYVTLNNPIGMQINDNVSAWYHKVHNIKGGS